MKCGSPEDPGSQEQDADEGRCDEGVIYGRNRVALDRAPRAKRGWEQMYGCRVRGGDCNRNLLVNKLNNK